jgi:hypothetical protein
MRGKSSQKHATNRELRGQVGFCHQIGGAFFTDLKPPEPIEQNLATGACGTFGDFDKLNHAMSFKLMPLREHLIGSGCRMSV